MTSTDSVTHERELISVQTGFWRSLWLVLCGARVRQWEWWDHINPMTEDEGFRDGIDDAVYE